MNPAALAILTTTLSGLFSLGCVYLKHLLDQRVKLREGKMKVRDATAEVGAKPEQIPGVNPGNRRFGCAFLWLWPTFIAPVSLLMGYVIAATLLYILAALALPFHLREAVKESSASQPQSWVSAQQTISSFLKDDVRLALLYGGVGVIAAMTGVLVGEAQRRLARSYLWRFWWWPIMNGLAWLIIALVMQSLIMEALMRTGVWYFAGMLSVYVQGIILGLLYNIAVPFFLLVFGNRSR